MPIANAIQKNNVVYVYNEKGLCLFSKPFGNRPGDGLRGYTGSAVSIKNGPYVHTFNEKGLQISAVPGG